VYRRAAEDDGLVPLRARVQPEILDALQLEAMTRRVSPGRLLIELLAEFLPMAAAERVRRQVAPALVARAVSGNDETPGADSRGSGSTSPKIVASANIAPRRPPGKRRGDAST
jgi:hypothetical protein